jgi:endonuclease YncB( thermonuclease family)
MRRDWKLRAAGFVVIGACLLAWRALSADPGWLEGQPDRIIDGDTFVMDGQVVRLWGIDAMESEQNCHAKDGSVWPCGLSATLKLRSLIEGGRGRSKAFACIAPEGKRRDFYGRLLMLCGVDGLDVGRELVLYGLAVAVAIDYKIAEFAARDKRLGFWAAHNVTPREWRKGKGRI